MWFGGLIILTLVVGIVIFLNIPFSPTKASFTDITEKRISEVSNKADIFTASDIEALPAPLQRYLTCCGYLGTPKMSCMRASFKDVDFIMSENKTIKIDYTQFNLAKRPERCALISSSLAGIPFEGLDSFENGKGSMKGTLAKVIPLFDQRGEGMDRACLVTWLAECLLVPSAALQDFIEWEEIDEENVKATISWEGMKAEGIFTFANNGELLSFRTSDRIAIDMDGKETIADWSAYFSEYHSVNGILQPKILQSVWHYQNGDCIYFNQNMSFVEFSYL